MPAFPPVLASARVAAAQSFGLSHEQRAWFASVGGVCVHVGPQAPLRDIDGAYARWFAARACEVALQRPDFAVFATAKEVGNGGALVEALRTTLLREFVGTLREQRGSS